jgi:peroxiredoxin
MRYRLYSILLIFTASLLASTNLAADDSKKEANKEVGPAVGDKAPSFTLSDQSGQKHSLSDYKGKIVVLEWISPECPFVQRHYKNDLMQKSHKKLAGEDVVWLAIDSSHFNKPKDSKKWIKKHDIAYPILQDPKGKVGQEYEAKTTPHMFVIDKKGIVRYNGAIDNDEFGKKETRKNYVAQAVKALKQGNKPDPSKTKPYGCSVKYKE